MKQLYLLAATLLITPALAEVAKYECPSVVMMQQAKQDAGASGQFNVENQGVKFNVQNWDALIVGMKSISGFSAKDKFDLTCEYSTPNDRVTFKATVVLKGENCKITDPSQGSVGSAIKTYNCKDPAVCPVVCNPTTINPKATKDGFTLEKGMEDSFQGKGIVGDIGIKTAD